MIETEYGPCGRTDVHAEHQTAKIEGPPDFSVRPPQKTIVWQKICPGVAEEVPPEPEGGKDEDG